MYTDSFEILSESNFERNGHHVKNLIELETNKCSEISLKT